MVRSGSTIGVSLKYQLRYCCTAHDIAYSLAVVFGYVTLTGTNPSDFIWGCTRRAYTCALVFLADDLRTGELLTTTSDVGNKVDKDLHSRLVVVVVVPLGLTRTGCHFGTWGGTSLDWGLDPTYTPSALVYGYDTTNTHIFTSPSSSSSSPRMLMRACISLSVRV